VDLETEPQVDAPTIQNFANRNRLETIETSAVIGKRAKEVFTKLVFEVYYRLQNQQTNPTTSSRAFVQPTQRNRFFGTLPGENYPYDIVPV
jgi:hypothetical protein